MIRKIGHILSALLLSVSLLFGGTAKEFVHLWAHHEDTLHDPHHECPQGETHFESEHHHCDFLGFVLAPFDGVSFSPRPIFYPRVERTDIYQHYESVFQPAVLKHWLSRGPPASV